MAKLPPDLEAILACPQCKGDLDFRVKDDEIVCPSCRLVFPIRDELPVMLVDEAKPLPASK